MLAGNGAFAFSQWLVVILLARLGTPTMVGQYTLGLAIGTPIVLLASLALRNVLVTDGGSSCHFPTYLRLRVTCMVAAFVAIVVVALSVGANAAVVIILVGAAKAVDAVADICYGLFQRHGRMRLIGTCMTTNAVLTVLLVAVILLATGDVVAAVAGSVAGSVAASAMAGLWCRRLGARPDAGAGRRPGAAPVEAVAGRGRPLIASRRLALVAVPVGLASSLTALAVSIPRYAVEATLGTAELGVFAALGFVVIAANTISGALAQVLLPAMTRMRTARRPDRLRSVTRRLMVAVAGGGVVAVPLALIFGRDLMRLTYGPAYAAHADVLAILTVAVVAQAAIYFLDTVLLALRRFGTELAAAVVMVLVAAPAGILLVPRAALAGAAWAVTIPAVVQLLYKSLMVHRALRTARRWASAGSDTTGHPPLPRPDSHPVGPGGGRRVGPAGDAACGHDVPRPA